MEAEEEAKRASAKEKILMGLAKISPEEEEERKRFLTRIGEKEKKAEGEEPVGKEEPLFTLEKPQAGIVYRPLPERQSSQEKILQRVLVFLLFTAICIAIYLLRYRYF